MKTKDHPRLTRRSSLGIPVIGGLAWLLSSASASAQQAQKASLLAKAVDRVPDDPQDPRWSDADLLDVPLAPQAVVKPRVFDAGIKALAVRALYDAEQLAILVTWRDPSRDTRIGSPETFRDAVAIEFPADPAFGIPHFAMGEPEKPVVIYQWKADWQFAEAQDEDSYYPQMVSDWYPFTGRAPGQIAAAADYAKADRAYVPPWHVGNILADREMQRRTAVEKLQAEGFGSLTTLPADRQDARGKAAWRDGAWSLVLTLPRAQDRFVFEPGMAIPIAFAAWEGGRRERGAEKAVSTWYFLSLEKPIGTLAYVSPVLAFFGALAVQIWGLRRLRQKVEGERRG